MLVPVVMRERPTVLLTERTTHLSTHSGQVAFPGGKRTKPIPTTAHTALREAHEEIGLHPGLVEVIGQMPTYTTGTQFIITPVVALVSPDHRLTLNTFEVADAFEVPLDFLMNPAHHRRHAVEWAGVRAGSGSPCLTWTAPPSVSSGAPPPPCCATSTASSRPE